MYLIEGKHSLNILKIAGWRMGRGVQGTIQTLRTEGQAGSW